MSSGICCITTFVGLAREIVVDQVNGCVVPFDDPQSVATRTLALVGEPALRARMGEQARATVLSTMDVRNTTLRMHDVYKAAIVQFGNHATRVDSAVTSLSHGSIARMDAGVITPLEWTVLSRACLMAR
jgi:hypothetical protein